MLKSGAASLLQTGASAVTNWGTYYKSGQPLLRNRADITNWGKIYYKLGQVLQIRAIITNWGIKALFESYMILMRVGNQKITIKIKVGAIEQICVLVTIK